MQRVRKRMRHRFDPCIHQCAFSRLPSGAGASRAEVGPRRTLLSFPTSLPIQPWQNCGLRESRTCDRLRANDNLDRRYIPARNSSQRLFEGVPPDFLRLVADVFNRLLLHPLVDAITCIGIDQRKNNRDPAGE